MSRKTVLKEMHPDANNQYEMSMSLWDVCRDCCDPQKRLLRQVSGSHRNAPSLLETGSYDVAVETSTDLITKPSHPRML